MKFNARQHLKDTLEKLFHGAGAPETKPVLLQADDATRERILKKHRDELGHKSTEVFPLTLETVLALPPGNGYFHYQIEEGCLIRKRLKEPLRFKATGEIAPIDSGDRPGVTFKNGKAVEWSFKDERGKVHSIAIPQERSGATLKASF